MISQFLTIFTPLKRVKLHTSATQKSPHQKTFSYPQKTKKENENSSNDIYMSIIHKNIES